MVLMLFDLDYLNLVILPKKILKKATLKQNWKNLAVLPKFIKNLPQNRCFRGKRFQARQGNGLSVSHRPIGDKPLDRIEPA